ncbi:MAG: hypothetical protein EP344_09585 [Bacteroidetes bacterium]|nr:MAG: hypothetical protein EP344_09585 [Bacteroidota bacterium]
MWMYIIYLKCHCWATWGIFHLACIAGSGGSHSAGYWMCPRSSIPIPCRKINPLYSMLRTLILLSILTGACFLQAQPVVWTGAGNRLDIGEQVRILEDPEGLFSIEQVSSDSFTEKYTPSKQPILNFGFTEKYHWFRFTLENKTSDDLWLEVANAYLPVTDLYYQDDSGNWQLYNAGYQVPLDQKLIKHHFQLFPLPSGKHTFYVRVLSYINPFPVYLWKKQAYEIKAQKQKLIYGFYTGFMLFVVLNNIFLFFSLRKFIYLHYGGLVFVYLAISAAVMDGYILYLFPQVNMIIWYSNLPIFNMVVALSYCITFLEVKRFLPRLYRYVQALLGLYAAYFILHFFLPLLTVLQINTLGATIVLFTMGFLGIRVGMNGNRIGYYFASAYIIFFVFNILEATYNFTGRPQYIFELSHVSIAIVLEALLLSYLLTKRFEWEKDEIEQARKQAQHKLLQKTLENERFVMEQNQVLEQKVEERTGQLQQANQELNTMLKTVEEEREKAETLLLNILPAATARELKETGHAQPRTYEQVTVLLTDFKDFTESTADIPPEQLVHDLDYCFSAFDRIMQQNGLEKIKTIGDAYLAVSGLPAPSPTHALNAVRAAMEIRSFIQDWKSRQIKAGLEAWDVRIGLHSGPVVAGVVGTHKFAYDIWGDTVNTAARMESSGTPGKVNISANTYELVKNDFICTPRGKINVKGKGALEMYWVESTPANS